MARWHKAPEVLEAAARWRERCLLQDTSILTDRALWTSSHLDELDRYFVQNLNWGEGDFFEKLAKQLAPASAAAKQLAAEIFWVMFIFVSSKQMGGASKRSAIKKVWEWSGEPLPENSVELGPLLDGGVGRPGTAYNTLRWKEFMFAIVAFQQWKRLNHGQRRQIMSDPWDFARWVDSLEASQGRQFRHILLYMLFPDSFERIATSRDKKAIVEHFQTSLGNDGAPVSYSDRTSVDRAILKVRERLGSRYSGEDLDFYSKELEPEWRPSHEPDPVSLSSDDFATWFQTTFGPSKVWVVSAGEGARLWPQFQRDKIFALDFPELADLGGFSSKESVRAALYEARKTGRDPINDALAAWEFSREMAVGDTLIVKRGLSELLGYGRIVGDYSFDDGRDEYQHLRKVDWQKTGSWNLPSGLFVPAKALTDVSNAKEWLRPAWEIVTHDTSPRVSSETSESFDLSELESTLFMPLDQFREIVDTLARKQCVILQGAPGVGKTFMARSIAYALMGVKDRTRTEMIQFHQSYAYEDFVQGWRPTGDGKFGLQDGVFHRFSMRASADLGNKYVFIIDEINRANLSKVFGELMLLIEADKRGPEFEVPLTYSPDKRFSVPPNLYLIGLMNTADRSLAMVDYALRRRFSFVTVKPAFKDGRFVQYLTDSGAPEALARRIAERMDALNAVIREDRDSLGPGYEVGHSFFVPSNGVDRLDDAWYERIIRSEIQPLLNEYWFDRPDRVTTEVERLLS